MNRIAVDIALLPDAAMTAEAIGANADLVERCGSEIVLDAKTCLPHVSLAMGAVEPSVIESVRKRLEGIAERHPVGELVVTGVVTSLNVRGESVSAFAIAKTKAIQSLHEQVMDALEPYGGYDVTEAMIYGTEAVAQTTLAWIRNFREKAAFAAYFPHITIGYGTVEQEMRFPMRFTAPRLAVCHLGNHCTCCKILASVRL